MKKYALIFAVIVLFICQAFAQKNNPKYLYNIGIKDSIYSEVLKEQRNIWIQLPDGGNLNPYLKYPVVFVLDGAVQMGNLTTVYENYWGNYLPKMILVGISNQTNRTRDLTTSDIQNPNMETGGAEKLTTFMEKELIPYIEDNYPVTSYRTLVGHSYAGLFTINMLINHSQLFANYIAIDPSLDWDNQKFLHKATEKLMSMKLDGKSLFITLASPLDREDNSATIESVLKSDSDNSLVSRSKLQFIRAAEKASEDNHLNISWKYYPEEIHGTVPLPSMMDGMKWLFDWYQLKDAAVYNNPETSVDVLKKHINDRAELLSKHFGYPVPPADEELLNMGGYMYLQMEQPAKAKLFFETQVKYYPWSPNAWDAMADYYISQDDSENAIGSLQKAYELTGDSAFLKKIENIEKDNN